MFTRKQTVLCLLLHCALQDAQPGQPMEVRDMVRDMNCATSQRVFIGECSGFQGGTQAAVMHGQQYQQQYVAMLPGPERFHCGQAVH